MKEIIKQANGTIKVLNSHKNGYYLINLSGHCSCAGFGYRMKCRHVDLLKREGLLDKKGEVIREKYVRKETKPKFIYDKTGCLIRVELIEV